VRKNTAHSGEVKKHFKEPPRTPKPQVHKPIAHRFSEGGTRRRSRSRRSRSRSRRKYYKR